MAALVTNYGLQRIGVQASQASSGGGPTYSATRHIQSMSVDDSSVAFAAGDDQLNDGGAVTNEADANFDATPTRSSQTISHVATFATGVANFVHKRYALHDDTAANVSSSSATLCAGVDGQSLTKTSSFSVTPTLTLAYTV